MAVALDSWAQDHVGCDDLTKSSLDIVRVPYFKGRPGTTVLMPVILEHDSIVTSFQFLVQIDTNWLRPVFTRDSSCAIGDETGCIVWNVDTTYIEHLITGRMLITDTTSGEFGPVIDTVNQFTVNLFQQKENVIACSMVPEFTTLDSLPGGDDTIFYVKLRVDPDMPHGTLARFTFYESDIFTIDDSVYPPDTTFFNGCNTSQMVTAWRNAQGGTDNYQVYPNFNLGYNFYFQCDTAYVPLDPAPTVVFTADPTSIVLNASSALSWTSAYADSVVIRTSTGTRLTGSANGSKSGTIIYTGTSVGTFSFTATAYGTQSRTAVGNATVTVTSGGGGGTGPSVTVSGLLDSYTQGEQIEFVVTATNTTANQISITASQMPSNASFGTGNQVIGLSPLSGTFSWTPDFNQSGSFQVLFTATDAGGSTPRYVTMQVEAIQYDRLFSTSKAGNRPVGGLPGRADIQFPIDLVSQQTVYGIQFDMNYPSVFLKLDSFIQSIRTPEYVVYENIGVTPGDVRVLTFGLNNEPVIDTTTTAVLYAMFTIDSSASPWTDLVIHLDNGRESVNPDPFYGSLPLVTDSGLIAIDSLGDVNLDRSIDVADVVNIVASIIETFVLTPRQFEVADIVHDLSVNVFDLVADINTILLTPIPTPAPPDPDQTAVLALSYGDIVTGGSEMVVMNAEIPDEVAAMQFEINYDASAVSFGKPVKTAADAHYTLHYNDNGSGRIRILLYNFASYVSGDFIQPGNVDLMEIPVTAKTGITSGDRTKIRLTEALLSTSVAQKINVDGIEPPLPTGFTLHQNYPNPFNPSTTIQFEIGLSDEGGDQNVRLDIFNILGQHVTTLVDGTFPPGEYDVTWDATDKTGQRVATGIYLYRLKIGDERKTKKMLFLK